MNENEVAAFILLLFPLGVAIWTHIDEYRYKHGRWPWQRKKER
jgi:hypothetical protein